MASCLPPGTHRGKGHPSNLNAPMSAGPGLLCALSSGGSGLQRQRPEKVTAARGGRAPPAGPARVIIWNTLLSSPPPGSPSVPPPPGPRAPSAPRPVPHLRPHNICAVSFPWLLYLELALSPWLSYKFSFSTVAPLCIPVQPGTVWTLMRSPKNIPLIKVGAAMRKVLC